MKHGWMHLSLRSKSTTTKKINNIMGHITTNLATNYWNYIQSSVSDMQSLLFPNVIPQVKSMAGWEKIDPLV